MELTSSGFMDPDEPKIIDIVTTWLEEGEDENDEGYVLHPEFVLRQSEEWEGWNTACAANVKPNSKEWKQTLEQDRLENVAWEVWSIFGSWLSDGDKLWDEEKNEWTPEDIISPDLIYRRKVSPYAHPEFIYRCREEWIYWNDQCKTKPGSVEWDQNIERDRLENIAWKFYLKQIYDPQQGAIHKSRTSIPNDPIPNDPIPNDPIPNDPIPNDMVTKCGCGVMPGEMHLDGCDIERCSVCGEQYSGECCEGHDKAFARWTGIYPGKAEAQYMGIHLNSFYAEKWPLIFFVKPECDES